MSTSLLSLLVLEARSYCRNQIRQMNLNETEAAICHYVLKHPGCSQEAACSALKIDKTTASKAVSAMEKRTLLLRETDEADKRMKRISLTPKGAAIGEKLSTVYNARNDEMLSALSPREQVQFEKSCEKILAMLKGDSRKEDRTIHSL